MTTPDPLHDLGVRLTDHDGEIRVWSESATSIELLIYDDTDPTWVQRRLPMHRGDHGVWSARSRHLTAGRGYALRAEGPTEPPHAFNPAIELLDPYARGISRRPDGWRSRVVDDRFDWGDARKPRVPLDRRVVYEAHVRGFSRRNPAVPDELRGSYAGLAHEASISYLLELGVTSVELLPVHAYVSEERLRKQSLVNYWGYNTLGFFAPHSGYASKAAQAEGASAVLREFKGMVKNLHEAGLEVILDVVYNHTAEEGPMGPTSSLRGLDNANYYRVDAHGGYIDVTGCGNTVNFGNDVPVRMVLDSLRYWAEEVQIDGFRFDLAATLGRDSMVNFTPDHPLLRGILDDPVLRDLALIVEPWDVGMGGWQTGHFPRGFVEWNDRYRDRMRDFWLGDIRTARETGSADSGIGRFATRLAGSSNTFATERGPLASLNFVTAHDGFTLADVVAYDHKHNLGNGENNRDGTDNNNSFNHGVEGPTADPVILAARRRAMRNLMGTLLLSAGVPMITAGDEFGRSQRGNNNAYCQDNELTWINWELEPWQVEMLEVTRTLLRLRRENPALRPEQFGRFGETVPGAAQMDWYNAEGASMSEEDWNSPSERTLQYLAANEHGDEQFNRVLVVVHALESETMITLPTHDGVDGYTLLWNSEDPAAPVDTKHPSGSTFNFGGPAILLMRAN